jgi:hypothetical protein
MTDHGGASSTLSNELDLFQAHDRDILDADASIVDQDESELNFWSSTFGKHLTHKADEKQKQGPHEPSSLEIDDHQGPVTLLPLSTSQISSERDIKL